MKWFWYSLIVFCLLMCSCKTKKLDSHVKVKSEVRSDLAILNESVKISTSNHAYFANEAQNIVIEEDIVVTEYDKETGKAIKETETKRKIIQDTNKVASKEEVKGESVINNDSTHHVADVSNMIDTESETVTKCNWLESFGKWLGIILGIAIVGYVIYLCIRKKLRWKMFG